MTYMHLVYTALTGLAFFISGQFLSAQTSQGQCDCVQDFDFVKNYLEQHYSGFRANVTEANRAQYQLHSDNIAAKARLNPTDETQCYQLLKTYLDFFKDRHLSISPDDGEAVDEKSAAAVAKFKSGKKFMSRERIPFDSAAIWQAVQRSTDPIEGIYENATYQVAVMANSTGNRDYIGVITRSQTPLWEPGQVKFDIKKIGRDAHDYVLFYRNHSYRMGSSTAKNPVFTIMDDFKKIHPTISANELSADFSSAPSGEWLQFKVLNDSTTYLHIKTFNAGMKSKFDSVYKQILPVIEQKNNLIIDIRDNGGGSDNNWRPLAKYLYTQPVTDDTTMVYCSPGTIRCYEEFLATVRKNRKQYGWTMKVFLKTRIKKMKQAPSGTFVRAEDAAVPWWGKPIVWWQQRQKSKVRKTPQQVILLYNRNSASASEGLILVAQQSKKVRTCGEHSYGAITFGDVMPVKTPAGFTLSIAVQFTPQRFQYEVNGIEPQVKLKKDRDWVMQAVELLGR
jgi:Peptidase family S41